MLKEIALSVSPDIDSLMQNDITPLLHDDTRRMAMTCMYLDFEQNATHSSSMKSLVDSPHKGPVMWKTFPCHDVIIERWHYTVTLSSLADHIHRMIGQCYNKTEIGDIRNNGILSNSVLVAHQYSGFQWRYGLSFVSFFFHKIVIVKVNLALQ